MSRLRSGPVRGVRGFTIVELMINLVIVGVVLTAIYQLVISQNRLYVKQREVEDVRTTLRSVANLLAFELRQTSVSNGDLYQTSAESLTVRSIQGGGVVCRKHGSQPRLALYATSGDIQAQAPDSLLIYARNLSQWLPMKVTTIWTSGGDPSHCAWDGGSSVPADMTMQVDPGAAPIDSVRVGDPVRAFRRTRYGIFERDGRWWLGRAVDGAVNYELLAGPLESPSDDGLRFIYYDADGDQTTTLADIRYVDIVLKGLSSGVAWQSGGGPPAAQSDTLTLRVALRG